MKTKMAVIEELSESYDSTTSSSQSSNINYILLLQKVPFSLIFFSPLLLSPLFSFPSLFPFPFSLFVLFSSFLCLLSPLSIPSSHYVPSMNIISFPCPLSCSLLPFPLQLYKSFCLLPPPLPPPLQGISSFSLLFVPFLCIFQGRRREGRRN